MKSKMILTSLGIAFLMFLNGGCATNSSLASTHYYDSRTGYIDQTTNYDDANYNVSYGPNASDTDFNHDSSVGYGGVNVY
ncbi:MAG: hypothetical protein Q8R24_10320 [Legionellaceae bacterium]|nr:hypothetical protein [Legionellaceae bacterium]